jgi:glycolate oxidase
MTAPGSAEFLRTLAAVLPPDALLTAPEQRKPYECDGLTAHKAVPRAVVLPRTEREVQAVLKACHGAGVPVVARGAGTGLSGGALPHPEGILLGLARLDQIVAVDPLARLARVQPGVRNLAISEAAAPFGLYYAPDPSSQIACTIGGNVAENSGGVHCLKYGLTVHNVASLRAVTIEGELLELGGDGLDAPGFDLLALLHGSEGLLAVITEITVRLLPKPDTARVALAAFDSTAAAGRAVAGVIAAGCLPAGLEMMDRLATAAVEQFVHAGYPADAAAVLLCECDGTAEEVEAELSRVNRMLKDCGATSIRISADEAERLKLWSGRKAAFPAVGRIQPDYFCMDGTIPRQKLAEVLDGIDALSREFGLQCPNVFHAGDGNLHPLIMFDANDPAQFDRALAFGARILELCIAAGGTITGEHGVGVEKIDQMCSQFGTAELATFHALKTAFDADGLLNPGKAIPTLRRCAEFGLMHGRSAGNRHPELPRF